MQMNIPRSLPVSLVASVLALPALTVAALAQYQSAAQQ